MAPSSSSRVRDLLVKLFTVKDFEIFVSDYYPELAHRMVWNCAIEHQAFDFVTLLRTEGLYEQLFLFGFLRNERPNHYAAINEVEEIVGREVGPGRTTHHHTSQRRRIGIAATPTTQHVKAISTDDDSEDAAVATLGTASLQAAGGAPGLRSALRRWTLATTTLLSLGALAAVLSTGSARPTRSSLRLVASDLAIRLGHAASIPTTPTQSTPRRDIHIVITSTPEGAAVVVDDQAIGHTPLDIYKPTQAEPRRFILRLAGHKPVEIIVPGSKDVQKIVRLERSRHPIPGTILYNPLKALPD